MAFFISCMMTCTALQEKSFKLATVCLYIVDNLRVAAGTSHRLLLQAEDTTAGIVRNT
jgi:hypothetical protein